MRRLEITAVLASDDSVSDRRIEAIAGATPDGSCWMVSHDDAIEGVHRGRWQFCVRDAAGGLHEVRVAEEGRVLRSIPDASAPDILFKLPRARITNYVFLRANEVVASKY